MAITKRGEPKPSHETAFIAGAGDAKPARFIRGKKAQITLSISPELLDHKLLFQFRFGSKTNQPDRYRQQTVYFADRERGAETGEQKSGVDRVPNGRVGAPSNQSVV